MWNVIWSKIPFLFIYDQGVVKDVFQTVKGCYLFGMELWIFLIFCTVWTFKKSTLEKAQ